MKIIIRPKENVCEIKCLDPMKFLWNKRFRLKGYVIKEKFRSEENVYENKGLDSMKMLTKKKRVKPNENDYENKGLDMKAKVLTQWNVSSSCVMRLITKQNDVVERKWKETEMVG
jgi:aryl carrier-like protein